MIGWRAGRFAAIALTLMASIAGAAERIGASAASQRGEHVFRLSGGCSCHMDVKKQGASLAGGRPLQTPFGVFFAPNITPDSDTGLGPWSEVDFIRAMTAGVGKHDQHLYPAFPYTSFTRMTGRDLKDPWAHLATVAPVRNTNREHDLLPRVGIRSAVRVWKAIKSLKPIVQKLEKKNR